MAATTEVRSDPMVQAFFSLHEVVFRDVSKKSEAFLEEFTGSFSELGKFKNDAEKAGSDYQHGYVKPLPEKVELEKQREALLEKYWTFNSMYQRALLHAENLKSAMNFLNLDARVIHPMLDSDCPEIAVHYHEIEKTARTQMAVLGTTLGRLESLAGKFIEQLTGKSGYVNWSVQRFCQIVDNDGKPLGVGMRILDNCTTPLVPKPKSWAPEVKTPVPVSTSGDPSLVAPSS